MIDSWQGRLSVEEFLKVRHFYEKFLKGTVSRDFLPLVFYSNYPLRPLIKG
jgi:hypothetical protein